MTQLYLVGNELVVTGFGLAGVKNVYTATPENIIDVLNDIKNKADIIVVTNELYICAEECIDKIRSSGKLVVGIPDRSGGGGDIISKLIKDTVGFEITSNKSDKQEGG